MIFAVKRSGLFDADNIHRLFHQTNNRTVTTRVGAEGAGLNFRQRAAARAGLDPLAGRENGLRELADRLTFGLHQVKRDSFGRPRTDTRQSIQGRDERGDRFGKGRHRVVEDPGVVLINYIA